MYFVDTIEMNIWVYAVYSYMDNEYEPKKGEARASQANNILSL